MNIAKRIFIGVAIAMIVWFLKTEVFALTVESRLQYLDNQEQVQNTSYVSAGTLMSIRPSTVYTFTRIFVRFNQSFLKDNIYRFEFRYQVNSNFYQFHGTCPDFSTVSSGATILNSSCSEVGDRYADIMFTVQFSSAMSTVTLGLGYNVIIPANTGTSFIVTNNSWEVTDIDSTYEAITNNTNIISNAIDGVSNYIDFQTVVIESIRDLISDISNATIGDESATTYSGSNYSGITVNGYDNAHLRGTGAGAHGISNSNQMNLDFDSYEQGSTTIWDFLSRLLNCHSEFILYFINILTLGFIRVVLNR